MEEVTVLPMVDTMVAGNNGGHVVSCKNATNIVSVEETKEQINGGVAENLDALRSAECFNDGAAGEISGSSTPVSTTSPSSRSARRKRGAFGLFRAVYLSFSRSDSIKKRDDAASPMKEAGADNDGKPPATASASWKSIVDGMRPLSLPGQELEYYPPPPPPPGHADVYHDVILSPPSPSPSPMRAGSERGMASRYASAQDLHLLDCGEPEGDEEVATAADAGSCPHAIDTQAEEFIAKFYEQFRMQKSESFNGRATDPE